MATKKATKNQRFSDAEADKLWTEFISSPAAMTEAQFDSAQQKLHNLPDKRTVRAGMFMLTKTGAELVDLVHKDDMSEALEELAECAQSQAELLRGVADAMQTAAVRLRVALCDSGELKHV